MIFEILILGASLVSCAGCWASVQKHRLDVELQRHKLDCEALNPAPPPVVTAPGPPPSPAQQSLTALLERRETLEAQISRLREQVGNANNTVYKQFRVDVLEALADSRKEQQELVLEQVGLLEMMQGPDDGTALPAEKSVRVDTGGPVAVEVDGPGQLHDAELHDEEAGRESAS